MIVFDLHCEDGGHRFEGWFATSTAFDQQEAAGLLCCPECGSAAIIKAPMAPAVGRKGNQAIAVLPALTPDNAAPAAVAGPVPAQVKHVIAKLAALQAEALKQSTWVGETFAEQSRAMHYGEKEQATIHGQATPDDAQALIEEGIAIMPLPFPVAPPDELN
ncbi:DUF1178 family protein [Novosphingobium sp.]|uniref:DUF1178 family protein n=1 Tax=Novosphingobium sp. TaxID=1874826 RepID=UPI0025F47310|nr:DUF1178 family protein [Novosphingobium sp.]